MRHKFWIYSIFLLLMLSCSKKESEGEYTPIPTSLNIPKLFKEKLINPIIPYDNPLTEEGIELGKKLFFDKILSRDNSQSCATCHDPKRAFTDKTRFSDGVDGQFGKRNSMPLFNLAWNFQDRFAWDGKELGLERQALEPVRNPIEMHSKWTNVARKLQNHSEYSLLFKRAFGTSTIDSTLVTKALLNLKEL